MRICPSCGKPLVADAPQDLCPECLMKAGFSTAAGEPNSGGFEPPSVASLAKLFPQLEIIELIGKGGMGAVYKARQPALDRLVALKILPPRPGNDAGFAERFAREARTLAKLNHPNIVAVYDFGLVPWPSSPGGSPAADPEKSPAVSATPSAGNRLHYFLMEYVDGPNLRQVERAGKSTPRQALQIIPQMCEALQFAHDEGVVHRDIKPENVLLDKRGRVKIADFGLAKILGIQPCDTRLTGVKDVMGTPHYMAPEQVESPQAVDHRADIYSLGVVFYEMLTGELPLGKFAPPSMRAGAVQIDVRLDEVVLHALEKEPARRYQQAGQIKTAVEQIASVPAQPPMAQAPGTAPVGAQVKWPALGLLATGILNWVLLPLALALLLPAVARHAAPMGPGRAMVLSLVITPFVLCSFLIYAALKMMRFEAYASSVAAGIIAMVVTPGNLLGFPVGIWALVVLSRPEVRAEFRRRGQIMLASGGPPNARWPWVAAAAALVVLVALIVFAQARGARLQAPQGPAATQLIANFQPGRNQPISGEASLSDGAWLVSCTSTQRVQLFEVPLSGVEGHTVFYQAKMKSDGLAGRAYLEMWCRLPGRGEFFSRGLDHVATDSNDWATYETPFYLKPGENPDLIRLNVVVEGPGRVWIKDVRLIRGPGGE
jgi:Protein kinase domain